MTNISLQRATIDDLEIFLNLEKSVSGSKLYSGTLSKKDAEKDIKENIVYLIKQDGVIVGSVDYKMINPHHAYINGLVINPKFQGRGIGRQTLLNLLANDLKSIKRIELVTHPHNVSAIRLYLSLGFIIELWKDNYFGDGEPRIKLVLVR